MITIQDIIKKAKLYKPDMDETRIMKAYCFSEEAHSGQKRFSGEPFIAHPLNVMDTLLEFRCDESTLIAALLHDVAEDTSRTLEEIEGVFGQEIRDLCWGMLKLSKVRSKLNDPQMENLRKLFWAMVKDFRVVLIKLCDRLHNMQTLQFVRSDKQTRIAQETLNIYAPIAARLGIYRLKSQLEDICFQYLYPKDFKDMKDQMAKSEKWRDKYMETAKQVLKETLSREGVQSTIDGRVKSLYSIYRKLRKKNKNSINDIFDVFAMRIVLPDIYKYDKEYMGHLYTVLGIIHNHFTPLANRFKDYIAVPKVNGYRSLHTTVMGLGTKIYAQPTEVQIRTETMHQNAELGIAAHWLYKEGEDFLNDDYKGIVNGAPLLSKEEATVNSIAPFLKKQKEWISGLGEMEKEIKVNEELFDNLKNDTLQDRIFVLTPRGDVKDLPVSATPIDFAYAVHTGIGNNCIGAKVNGTVVRLDYELKSGEVVEIITRKNAKPSHQWLSFVKTSHARNRIRNWFHGLDRDKHLRTGRELLNKKLSQLGKPTLDVNLSILREYEGKHISFSKREDLLVEIGKGTLFSTTVIRKIFTLEDLLGSQSVYFKPADKAGAAKEKNISAADDTQKEKNLFIGGEKNMLHHFAKCCSADGSQHLMGYVTRGRGVSVHKKDCKVLSNIEPGRLIAVGTKAQRNLCRVKIRVEADDRVGLIRDISEAIAGSSINIVDMSYQEDKTSRISAISFILEIEDFDQLERLFPRLEKISSVRRAFKIN